MRNTSSPIRTFLLGFGLIGLGLAALIRSDSGVVPPPAVQTDPVSDGSVSAPMSLFDSGSLGSGREARDGPQAAPIHEELRAAVASVVEKDSYDVAQSREKGEYQAVNREQGMQIYFSSEGIHVRPRGGYSVSWEFGMSLSGVGYGAHTPPALEGTLNANGNRVEYGRVTGDGSALTEWYVNTPRGLEQGFTLLTNPTTPRGSGDPLVLEFEISGDLNPSLSKDGRAISFATDEGMCALRYSDLHAFDARGAELPSSLRMRDGRLALLVEDGDALYPLTIDPLVATQEAKLTASDAATEDEFGISVSISGNTAVVGAHKSGNRSGSAYVFLRSGTTWNEQAKLIASDAAVGERFGFSVAISGETALIGAFRNDGFGAAYVFQRSGAAWSEQAKLTASDAGASDFFGVAVAISGNTAVIGARLDDDAGMDSGSAYVFHRSGSAWTEQAKLTAGDAASGDLFGYSVAISGDIAVVGAIGDQPTGPGTGLIGAGAAYVFSRSGSTWTPQAKLTAAGDRFGICVSISGDTALVGAPSDNDSAGSAYVFLRSGTTWSQQAKLTADDAAAGDQFGFSVAIYGDAALVGTPHDGDAGVFSGSAYVFARSGTVWNQDAKVTASDGSAFDLFGRDVALSGESALIGALRDDVPWAQSGSAYAYRLGNDSIGLLEILIEEVHALQTQQGIINSFAAKLQAALRALQDVNASNNTLAVGALHAFIKAVTAQSGVQISVVDADALIARAQQVIDLLQGS